MNLEELKAKILNQLQREEFTQGNAVIPVPASQESMALEAIKALRDEFMRRQVNPILIVHEDEEPEKKLTISCRLIGDKRMLDHLCTLFKMNGLSPKCGNDYPVQKGKESRRYVNLTQTLSDLEQTLSASSVLVIALIEACAMAAQATGQDPRALRRELFTKAHEIYLKSSPEECRQYCVENLGIDPEALI